MISLIFAVYSDPASACCVPYLQILTNNSHCDYFHSFFLERYNQRVKVYEFLDEPIEHWKYCILEEVIYVVSFLANFTRLLAE